MPIASAKTSWSPSMRATFLPAIRATKATATFVKLEVAGVDAFPATLLSAICVNVNTHGLVGLGGA
jgi:hypothetical protein